MATKKPRASPRKREEVTSDTPRVVDYLRQAGERTKIAKPTEAFHRYVQRAVELQSEISTVNATLAKLTEEYKRLIEDEIPLAMLHMRVVDKNNKGSVTLEDGTRVFLKPKRFPTVLVQDNDYLIEWLRDIGQGSEIKNTVHHNTLTRIVNEIADTQGEEALPGFVKLFKRTTATIQIPKTEN
jgi:hypothetical protein